MPKNEDMAFDKEWEGVLLALGLEEEAELLTGELRG